MSLNFYTRNEHFSLSICWGWLLPYSWRTADFLQPTPGISKERFFGETVPQSEAWRSLPQINWWKNFSTLKCWCVYMTSICFDVNQPQLPELKVEDKNRVSSSFYGVYDTGWPLNLSTLLFTLLRILTKIRGHFFSRVARWSLVNSYIDIWRHIKI